MSNITIVDPFIITLSIIQQSIARYGYSINFILGNIGSLLNILVLSQRNYLRNSCSSYILASSLPNLLVINVIIFFRILITFGFDPTSTSIVFCKFKWYTVHSMTLLSRTYILLACIDRWAMTSTIVRRRAFAHIKISMFVIPATGLFWCIISIHVLLYQDIVGDRCGPGSNTYALFFNTYNTIVAGLLIPILMCIFGLATIRNVKRLQHRVNVRVQMINAIILKQENRPNLSHRKSYDYQLLFMVLAQIFVYVITTLPFVIYSLYSVVTMTWSKSSTQLAIERVCISIAYTLVLTNFCVTFYIYILTSNTFRKELKRLLSRKRLISLFFGDRYNPQVRPLPHIRVQMETLDANKYKR